MTPRLRQVMGKAEWLPVRMFSPRVCAFLLDGASVKTSC